MHTHTPTTHACKCVCVCMRSLLFIFAHLRCLSDAIDALGEVEAETSCEKLLCAALCVLVSMCVPVYVCLCLCVFVCFTFTLAAYKN